MNNNLTDIRFKSDTNYILRCCDKIKNALADNDNDSATYYINRIAETIAIMKTEKS